MASRGKNPYMASRGKTSGQISGFVLYLNHTWLSICVLLPVYLCTYMVVHEDIRLSDAQKYTFTVPIKYFRYDR